MSVELISRNNDYSRETVYGLPLIIGKLPIVRGGPLTIPLELRRVKTLGETF